MKKLAQIKKKLYLCALVFAQTQENCLVKGEKHNEMTKPLHTISSNANIHVFGTTGAASSSPSTGGWSSLSNKKTASFSTIQQEVIQTVTYFPGHTYKAYNPNEGTLYTEQPQGPRRIAFPGQGDSGYVPPTGQTDPNFASPIGDPLLPILLLVCLYTIGRSLISRIKKLKTSNVLKS
jgi:hypothetical protein